MECEDLSGYYRDDAAANGLVPGAPAIAPGSTCGQSTLYEPNDLPAQACVIQLGAAISSELGASGDTVDYYRFEVQQGVTYTLEFQTAGSLERSVTVAVGSQTSTLLARAWVPYGKEHVEFVAERSGTATLMLGGSGKYDVTVLPSTAAGLVHDALTYEPNNTYTTAAPVCVGVPVQGAFTSSTDDIDQYAFQVFKGVTYTLKLVHEASVNRSLLMRVGKEVLTWRPWGNPMQFYTSGVEYEEFTPTTSGVAVLAVGSSAPYEATILPSTEAGLAHDPVTYEPNDSPSTYTPLALGASVTSELSSGADKIDYFGIPVEAGVTYALSTTRSGQIGRKAVMRVGADTLTLIPDGALGSGSSTETFVAPTSGIVLVSVQGAKYSLQLTKL